MCIPQLLFFINEKLKMISAFVNLISLILILIYMYYKTRTRASLVRLLYPFFLILSFCIHSYFFPHSPLGRNTPENIVFLLITGISLFAMLIFEAVQYEKNGFTAYDSLSYILKPTKENIYFWLFIIFINFIAFLLEN